MLTLELLSPSLLQIASREGVSFCRYSVVPFRPLCKDAGEAKEKKPLPPGAKWITVHPHDGAGVPILIQEHPSGTASVIGGAGGKLNMLHLNRIGSPQEWKERAAKKKQKESDRVAQQSEEQKTTEKDEKGKAISVHVQKRQENALATIEALEKNGIDHGLTDEQKLAITSAPPSDADAATVATYKEARKAAFGKIKDIHRAYEHKLVTDHTARQLAAIGDIDQNVPVEGQSHTASDKDGNAIASLTQLPNGSWLASSSDPEKAGENYKSWEEAAKAHARNVNEADALSGQMSQGAGFYDPRQWARQPDGVGAEFKPEAAAAILKLSQERKANDKSLKQAQKEIEKGSAFDAGAYAARVEQITDQDVMAKLEAEAKTISDATINNKFLSAVNDAGEAEKMRAPIMVGGYGKLSEISSDVLKQNVISQALVEKLGHNEAAKLLAFQIRNAVPPEEYELITAAQAAYHAKTSAKIAKAATDKVKPMLDQLKSLHEDMIHLDAEADGDLTPEQQIRMDSMNYDAKTIQAEVQKQLGSTLGALQASAAVVAALEAKPNSMSFHGDASDKLEDLIPGLEPDPDKPSLLGAFGLGEGDFDLREDEDGKRVVQVNAAGMAKMGVGYNPEDKAAYEQAVAIKRGDFDIEGFVPDGFSHYAQGTSKAARDGANTDAQFDVNLDVFSKLEKGTLSDEEIQESLKSYIGARAANGENPLFVKDDLLSPSFYAQQGVAPDSPEAIRVQSAMSDLVVKMAGADTSKGLKISEKAIREGFQALGDAEAAKQRKSRKTDDLEALHSQSVDSDAATEAIHVALANKPLARVAFKEGKLSSKERKQLREYAIQEVLGQDLEAVEPKQKGEAKAPANVAEKQYDLFGNEITAEEAMGGSDEPEPEKLTQWQQFSKVMGGDAKAYEAATDHLRGKFMNSFAGAYSVLAGKPLAVGGENIKHVDRLELAKLNEEQRAEMLAAIQSRTASEKASVQARSGGKWTEDPHLLEKLEEIKGAGRQINLFTSDEVKKPDSGDYQRTTVGKQAEAQIAQLAQKVIPNFEQLASGADIIDGINWGKGTAHATKQRALKFLETQKKVGIHFGAGCVHGSTLLRCEKTGIEQSFADWWISGIQPWVTALNRETWQTEVIEASPVFVKGWEEMYLVTLEGGQEIVVTAGHRFLGQDGWQCLGDLAVGDEIAVSPSQQLFSSSPTASFADLQSSSRDKHQTPTTVSASQSAVFGDRQTMNSFDRDTEKLHPHEAASICQKRISCDPLSTRDFSEPPTNCGEVFHTYPFADKQKSIQRLRCSQFHKRSSLHRHTSDEVHRQKPMSPCSLCASGYRNNLKPCLQWHDSPGRFGQFRKRLSVLANRAFLTRLLTHQIPAFYRQFCEPLASRLYPRPSQVLDFARSGQLSNALTEKKIAEGSGCRCSAYSHRRDVQLRWGAGIDLGGQTSQFDALSHIQISPPLDALGRKCERTHTCQPNSFPYQFDAAYSKILGIKRKHKHLVFDITVPHLQNYLAQGIFSHNSGKSSIMLGCFSHLHAQGKVKKMVVAVPSSIVGQFIGEGVSFLEAGKYDYKANLGMNQEDRLKTLADPDNNIFVTTRESLSNDLLHLVQKHEEVSPDDFREKPEDEQHRLIKAACDKEGIDTDGLMLAVDEAHDISARQGVDASKRSLSLNSLGRHSAYYMQASGDLLKNDISEAYSFLHAVAPDKFNNQAKFMATYGKDSAASRRALQRAIAPYSFSASTKPTRKENGETRQIKKTETQPIIPVSEHIAKERQNILDDVATIGAWRTDRQNELKAQHGDDYRPVPADFNTAFDNPSVREAIGRLGSADTWGTMSDEDKAAKIGGQVIATGAMKRTALKRLYHRTEFKDNPKAQWTVDTCVDKFKNGGKPGIVFSQSSQAAEMLVEQLKKKGMRVAYIHGGLSGEQKDAERLKFSPGGGKERQADILICTDAARTGLNLTSGKFLIHYDVPDTEMSYSQRSARIFRLKQDQDVEIMTPLLDAPEEKIAWSRMQRKGDIASPLKAKVEHLDDSGLSGEIQAMRNSAAKT